MLPSSAGIYYVFRLHPHEDLKKGILQFAAEQKVNAGAIVSCVGSLEHTSIRYANQATSVERAGHFEILSLSGTFSSTSAHLHLAIADNEGRTSGGHLLENNRVFTTAEVVVVCFPELELFRELDNTYGYHELAIRQSQ